MKNFEKGDIVRFENNDNLLTFFEVVGYLEDGQLSISDNQCKEEWSCSPKLLTLVCHSYDRKDIK